MWLSIYPASKTIFSNRLRLCAKTLHLCRILSDVCGFTLVQLSDEKSRSSWLKYCWLNNDYVIISINKSLQRTTSLLQAFFFCRLVFINDIYIYWIDSTGFSLMIDCLLIPGSAWYLSTFTTFPNVFEPESKITIYLLQVYFQIWKQVPSTTRCKIWLNWPIGRAQFDFLTRLAGRVVVCSRLDLFRTIAAS
jgi:hypothetical protein